LLRRLPEWDSACRKTWAERTKTEERLSRKGNARRGTQRRTCLEN